MDKYLTQSELAKKANCSRSYISQLVNLRGRFTIEIIAGMKIIVNDSKVRSFLEETKKLK